MSRKIFLFLAVSFFVFSGCSQTVQNTQSKCAVVFSNTTYPQNKIPSALKDGIKISTALQRNRFKVYYNENVSKDRFFISLKSFAEKHIFLLLQYTAKPQGFHLC